MRVGHRSRCADVRARGSARTSEPEHYLWPACQWGRYDPCNPMLKWDTAWRALRDEAGLHGLRFHDLRHTVITELAEMGVADLSSNRSAATCRAGCWSTTRKSGSTRKRQALDGLDDLRRAGDGADGNGKPANDGGIETTVEVADQLTSQSSQFAFAGSPPSGKLLIPLKRRDGRVVEGARLESVCRKLYRGFESLSLANLTH